MVTFNFTISVNPNCKEIFLTDTGTYTLPILFKILQFKDKRSGVVTELNITDFLPVLTVYTIPYNLPDALYEVTLKIIEDNSGTEVTTISDILKFYNICNAQLCTFKALAAFPKEFLCLNNKAEPLNTLLTYMYALKTSVEKESSNDMYSYLHVINRIVKNPVFKDCCN
jgi:hypothetical protein